MDPQTLRPVDPEEPGGALATGPHLPRAYWNNPKETEEAFVQLGDKIWYRTGDVLRMDGQGWLLFRDGPRS